MTDPRADEIRAWNAANKRAIREYQLHPFSNPHDTVAALKADGVTEYRRRLDAAGKQQAYRARRAAR